MEITESSLRARFLSADMLRKLMFFVGAAVFVVAIAAVIQVFARYQYVVEHGVIWRIDRLTQQTCRVSNGQVYCGLPKSTSISTSVSPSLSTSAAVTHPR